MSRHFAALAFSAVMTLAWAGCKSAPEVLVPKRTITAALDPDGKRTPVKAKVGDLIKLELPPVELAGYGWQVVLHDARFLKQMTEILPAATAGGRTNVGFLTLRPVAKSTIRFVLVKLDGREAQPIDGHDVVFAITP